MVDAGANWLAAVGHAQLEEEWEVLISLKEADLPFQYRHFSHVNTGIDESNFSGSLLVCGHFKNPTNDAEQLRHFTHITPTGKIVGSWTFFQRTVIRGGVRFSLVLIG